MIGVIADDLTGAAELGAIGLRCGLTSELVLNGQPSVDCKLVCVSTNSRSCTEAAAAERAAAAAQLLSLFQAEWIYKKVDSVLRGHVGVEVEAVLGQLGLDTALLVPANPSLGRVIRDGYYFVGGRPIHETEFSFDPEHPRKSSAVAEMIRSTKRLSIHVCRHHDCIPSSGIVIGQAETIEDLRQWARRRVPEIMMGGGGEFFAALLAGGERTRTIYSSKARGAERTSEFFVCGTTSKASSEFMQRARDHGTPVFSLPDALTQGADFTAEMANTIARHIVAAFRSTPRVILTVGLPLMAHKATAVRFSGHLAQIAESVINESKVGHVYAEGGATAEELARGMGWTRLEVLRELAPGVVTARVATDRKMLFTMKPGSYAWPAEI